MIDHPTDRNLSTRPQRSNGSAERTGAPPRLGFVGLGWIGTLRMKGLLEYQAANVVALADTDRDALEEGLALAPEAEPVTSMDELLKMDLDGVVIATPNALHARQACKALRAGLPVFCQKPLGRTTGETCRVIEAAREADRLLAVDFSYRHTEGMQQVKRLVDEGAIGDVFAARLVFHNAYGPDKDWYYDCARSGGGCVMDLGSHLIDLALWALDFPTVESIDARIFGQGKPLEDNAQEAEDFASIRLGLDGGAAVDVACSWNLAAGQDAVIEACFYGGEGSLAFRNVGGSFFDFVAEHHRGTATERLCSPPDPWGSRGLQRWAEQLVHDSTFNPAVESALSVAKVVDAVCGRIYHPDVPALDKR